MVNTVKGFRLYIFALLNKRLCYLTPLTGILSCLELHNKSFVYKA